MDFVKNCSLLHKVAWVILAFVCFFQSAQGSHAVEVASDQLPPIPSSLRDTSGIQERLEVLSQERDEIQIRRQQLEKTGSPALLAQADQSLMVINRQIEQLLHDSHESRAPLPESRMEAEKNIYEAWDVFENFGQKDQK